MTKNTEKKLKTEKYFIFYFIFFFNLCNYMCFLHVCLLCFKHIVVSLQLDKGHNLHFVLLVDRLKNEILFIYRLLFNFIIVSIVTEIPRDKRRLYKSSLFSKLNTTLNNQVVCT